MSTKSRPATTKEIVEIARLLRQGRNRYDNALLQIEQVWNKLSPRDYVRRAELIRSATAMLDIDKSLRVWEDKLKQQS